MAMESQHFYRFSQTFCFSNSSHKKNQLLIQNFRKYEKTLASSVTLEDYCLYLRVPERLRNMKRGRDSRKKTGRITLGL